jgi:hypothetical protein
MSDATAVKVKFAGISRPLPSAQSRAPISFHNPFVVAKTVVSTSSKPINKKSIETVNVIAAVKSSSRRFSIALNDGSGLVSVIGFMSFGTKL